MTLPWLTSVGTLLVMSCNDLGSTQLNSGEASGLNNKPNVVLIVLDDLNDYIEPLYEQFKLANGETTFIGHPQTKTPNMKRLASKGTTFTRAYSNNPICAPSRASFLYGIHPHKSKNTYFDNPKDNTILKNSQSIMEHFKANGYKVKGVGKIFHKSMKKHFHNHAGGKSLGPVAYVKKCETNAEGKPTNCQKYRRTSHPWNQNPYRSQGSLMGYGPFVDLQMPQDTTGWFPMFVPGTPAGDKVTETGWIRDFPSGYGAKFKQAKDIFIVKDPNRELTAAERVQGKVKLIPEYNAQGEIVLERELTTDEKSANYAVGQLSNLKNEGPNAQPLFLAVGFMRPHAPFYAPQKNFDRFPLTNLVPPPYQENDPSDTAYARSGKGRSGFKKLTQSLQADPNAASTLTDKLRGVKDYTRAYLATINFVDEQIGQVLDAVEELNRQNPNRETIVALVSDHGYHTGQKDYIIKDAPWEQTTKVPLIIWRSHQPKTTQGQKVTLPVSLIDLYPTLKDLAGVEGDTQKNQKGLPLDGSSLKILMDSPDLKQRPTGPKEVLTMVSGHLGGTQTKPLKDHHYTLRSSDWRYIQYRTCKKELYYHGNDTTIAATDPHEWNNLALITNEDGSLKYKTQLDQFHQILRDRLSSSESETKQLKLPNCL